MLTTEQCGKFLARGNSPAQTLNLSIDQLFGGYFICEDAGSRNLQIKIESNRNFVENSLTLQSFLEKYPREISANRSQIFINFLQINFALIENAFFVIFNKKK